MDISLIAISLCGIQENTLEYIFRSIFTAVVKKKEARMIGNLRNNNASELGE